MKEIRTKIEIDAPDEIVWRILTGFAAYPDWNPFITEIDGQITVGEKLDVRIEPPGGSAMKFKPTVTRFESGLELRWKGNFILPGLFDGEHVFEVAWMGERTTYFRQWERFSGLLVPLMWKGVEPKTRRGFEAMNRALKKRAESRV